MGILRRKDERAIPKPGSKEFEEAIRGAPVEPGAAEPEPSEPSIEPTEEAEEEPEATVEETGPHPDESGEPDERTRRGKVLGSLGRSILKPPNAEGFGGGIPGPKQKRKPEI